MTSFSDDCENTFNIANTVFNFTKVSEDFKDDCLDIPGILLSMNSQLFIKLECILAKYSSVAALGHWPCITISCCSCVHYGNSEGYDTY